MLTDQELEQEKKINLREQKKAAPYCPHCRKKMKFVISNGMYMEAPYYCTYQCCDLVITRHFYFDDEDDGWVDYVDRPRYSLRDMKPLNKR